MIYTSSQDQSGRFNLFVWSDVIRTLVTVVLGIIYVLYTGSRWPLSWRVYGCLSMIVVFGSSFCLGLLIDYWRAERLHQLGNSPIEIDETFMRRAGYVHESVYIRTIQKVLISTDSESVTRIQVIADNEVMDISGYDDMDGMLREIESRLSELQRSMVVRVPFGMNYKNLIPILVLLTVVPFYLAWRFHSTLASWIILLVVNTSIALYMIFIKPISRGISQRKRTQEWIGVLLLVIIAVLFFWFFIR